MADKTWVDDVHYGSFDAPLPEVPEVPDADDDDADPDDEELPETPPNVVAILGFDPLTEQDEAVT